MTTSTYTAQQLADLDTARELARAGVPLFVAAPTTANKLGFALPDKWDRTVADPAVVDTWAPGLMLCAVMGHGLDLIDIDPRNGGDLAAMDGETPASYAIAATPSGGMHSYIRSLGVGCRDNVYPGIDIKGGNADGSGRGLAFLPPTVRASKVTGQPAPYQWLVRPDLAKLTREDSTGAALAEKIRALKAGTGAVVKTAADVPDWWLEYANQREPHSEQAAQKAIADKLTAVVSWKRDSGEGFRTVIMRAAMTLGGYVGGGYLAADQATEALTEACAAVWGEADADDLLWIRQGLTDGAAAPFGVYTVADEMLAATGEPPTAWNIYTVLGTHPFETKGTDQEMAQDVSMRIRPALRYAPSAGLWVVRDQHIWHEAEAMADWAVSTLARVMPLGNLDADKDTEEYRKAKRRGKFMSSGSAGIEKKLRSIVRHPRDPMSLDITECDSDPHVLWAGGLPWDLAASTEVPVLSAVDPATPHLRTAACTPVAMATPYWDAFVAAVWPDEAVRTWALRVLGISLTGNADEAVPVLYGPERNGKTSLVSFLVRALGSYAHAADPRLLAGADNVHASVVYALKGRRLSFIDEGPRRGHLAIERLKQLTGGGELTGNAMRSNPITFAPTHTLVMTTNEEPGVTDPAMAARLRVIPCEGDRAAVRAARRALHPGVWAIEMPGVLAAMMAEAAAWLADPDTARNEAAPAHIRSAVDEMKRAQDPVAEWVDLCTLPATPGDQAAKLFTHFCEWHDASAVHRKAMRPSQTAFGRRLTELGYPASDLSLPGVRATLRYRPLSILQGWTGPFVPPPSDPGTSADAENTGRVVETVRNEEAPRSGSDSANAEQARSTDREGDAEANCANANGVNREETDNQDVPGTSHSEVVRRVGGGLEEGCSAKLSSPETASSDHAGRSFEDSEDSFSTLSQTNNKKDDQYTLMGDRDVSQGEIGETLATLLGDLGSPPTSAPPITCDDVRRVEETKPSSVILVPPTLLDSEKSINSDLGPGSGDSITARLLASANAGGTASPKLSEMKTIIKQTKQDKISPTPAKRVKLTPEQREANKIAKAAVVAAAKAELRAAAVAAAAGQTVPLPAVVFRGQQPRSVTMTEAAEIVRTATARAGGKCDVDIESSGYPIGHPLHAVRTVQLGDLMAAVVFAATDAAQLALTGELIAEAPRLGAFSATADLAPLAHLGAIDHEAAWAKMEDAVIPAKLADPAGAGSDAAEGLKALSAVTLGPLAVAPAAEAAKDELAKAAGWTFAPKLGETAHDRNGWAMVASDCATMVTYAASDVLDTAAVVVRLPDPGPVLLGRERALQRLVARVTYTGVRIDGELSARLLDEHQSASNTAAVAVRSFGIDNPGSSQQVAARLTAMGLALPRTAPSKSYPNGQLSVKNEALMGLRAEGLDGDAAILVDQLLEFGSHKNAISTFLGPYVAICRDGDGRARPTVYTMEAKTGRMSCVRPNFQNIPREGGFRAQIIADAGYLQIGADFSGVELRVAAALSQDQHLIEIILADDAAKRINPKAKSDIHWKIAQAAYGPNATKAQRYNVKRAVFGRLYGSGVEGIKNTLGITMREAQMIVEILDSMTPGLAAWSRRLGGLVKSGYTDFPTHSGRIIHLRSPHSAPNYAIQGTAREIIVDALIKWSNTQWGRCVLWPVHDEVDVMVPATEAVDATAALVDCMETTFMGVPIIAEAATPSAYWCDAA